MTLRIVGQTKEKGQRFGIGGAKDQSRVRQLRSQLLLDQVAQQPYGSRLAGAKALKKHKKHGKMGTGKGDVQCRETLLENQSCIELAADESGRHGLAQRGLIALEPVLGQCLFGLKPGHGMFDIAKLVLRRRPRVLGIAGKPLENL